MSSVTAPAGDASHYLSAGAWSLAVIALTGLHHVYGAIAFDTPWRLHILFIGLPFATIIVASLLMAHTWSGSFAGRVALWIGLAAMVSFPIVLIGLYEGGLNHVAKNVVYLGWGTDGVAAMTAIARLPGIAQLLQVIVGPAAYADMLANGMYELPHDAVFEVTGIAQFFVALVAAREAYRLWAARS